MVEQRLAKPSGVKAYVGSSPIFSAKIITKVYDRMNRIIKFERSYGKERHGI